MTNPETETCAVCPRTLRDDEEGRPVCNLCEHRMRGWLCELPLHLPLLQASLVPGRQGLATGTRGRANSPSPAREDVLNLIGPAAPGTVHAHQAGTTGDQTGHVPLAARLHAWADQLAADRDEVLGPSRPGRLHTGYLAAHLPYALRRPWYPHMHDEIRDLVHHCRAITRVRPRRYPLAAHCPAPECQAFRLVGEDWSEWIVCEECGRRLTHDAYTAHEKTVMPPLYRTALLLVTHHAHEDQQLPETG